MANGVFAFIVSSSSAFDLVPLMCQQHLVARMRVRVQNMPLSSAM